MLNATIFLFTSACLQDLIFFDINLL